MIYYYKSHRWINGKLKKIITDEKICNKLDICKNDINET